MAKKITTKALENIKDAKRKAVTSVSQSRQMENAMKPVI